MGYKTLVTKKCSECGNVLKTKIVDYCDGCNRKINQKHYDKHVRVGFQMSDHESRKDELVFHSLECFLENLDKIDLTGVGNISLDYMAPEMWLKIVELIKKVKP